MAGRMGDEMFSSSALERDLNSREDHVLSGKLRGGTQSGLQAPAADRQQHQTDELQRRVWNVTAE
jgi:hypothetical protein